MRTPAKRTAVPRTMVSVTKSYAAPVGGWNARDALAAMKPTDAVTLENIMPQTTYLEGRGGWSDHLTDMTGNGKTLAVYNALNGTNEMFCATADGLYDATSAGTAGASVAVITNGKWQWTMFGDGSANYLIMVNGVDAPLYYDGSNWIVITGVSSPALSGVTLTDLIHVNSHKGRLYFIQKNTLSFWYLAAGAAGGALTEFDLSGEAPAGGYLIAMATWSRDAGDGMDDMAVFITSEGEAIVYQGNDPNDANYWAKVGTFYVGRPLGRRCFCKVGGDVALVLENGTFPLSSALQSATVDSKMALSFKIERAFTDAARSYGSTFGWKPIVYPAQNALLVNVPITEDGEHEQYVMNTITKSWTKFKEWDAEDFAIFNGELYFTTSNKVVKAWTGTSDGGTDIVFYGKTAFSYFNSPGKTKKFKMFRPMLAVNGNLNFYTGIDVDFKDEPISGTATYTVTAGAQWDVDSWDAGYWSSDLEMISKWSSPAAWDGIAAAGKIKIASNALTIQWVANDWIYERE